MKNKISLLCIGTFLSLMAAMFCVSCTQENAVIKTLDNQQTDQLEMPDEMALRLTEEEIATFYAEKPTYIPTSNYAEERGKRPKRWRPFMAWADVMGTIYPVLDNCTDPNNADICFEDDPCMEDFDPSPPFVPPFVGYSAGEAHMTAYGKVRQTWIRWVCPPVWFNGTYEKGEHRLQYYNVPPLMVTVEDGVTSIEFDVKVCKTVDGDPSCWSYNTGDFEDSEGILHHRWKGVIDPTQPMFEPAFAETLTWGWLWY